MWTPFFSLVYCSYFSNFFFLQLKTELNNISPHSLLLNCSIVDISSKYTRHLDNVVTELSSPLEFSVNLKMQCHLIFLSDHF